MTLPAIGGFARGLTRGFPMGFNIRQLIIENRRRRAYEDEVRARERERASRETYDWRQQRGVEPATAADQYPGAEFTPPEFGSSAAIGRNLQRNPLVPGGMHFGTSPESIDPGFTARTPAAPGPVDTGFARAPRLGPQPTDRGFVRRPGERRFDAPEADVVGGYRKVRATPSEQQEFHRAEMAAAVGNRLTEMYGTYDEFTPQERTLVGLGMLPAERPLPYEERLKLQAKYGVGVTRGRQVTMPEAIASVRAMSTRYVYNPRTNAYDVQMTRDDEEITRLARQMVADNVQPSEYRLPPPAPPELSPEEAPEEPGFFQRTGEYIKGLFSTPEGAPGQEPTGRRRTGPERMGYRGGLRTEASNEAAPGIGQLPSQIETGAQRLQRLQALWDRARAANPYERPRYPRPTGIDASGRVY